MRRLATARLRYVLAPPIPSWQSVLSSALSAAIASFSAASSSAGRDSCAGLPAKAILSGGAKTRGFRFELQWEKRKQEQTKNERYQRRKKQKTKKQKNLLLRKPETERKYMRKTEKIVAIPIMDQIRTKSQRGESNGGRHQRDEGAHSGSRKKKE
jgi:hypothetical protein